MCMLFLVAWIAYANALHNSLAFDDATFSASNRSWDLSFSKVSHYFTSDAWAAAGKESGLYRPLFLLAVSAETMVFGDWYTGYHLVNVLYHSLVVLALFSLIQYLMMSTGCTPRLSGYAALISSLVFAVHPVNTEVVNSIFNRSGMLVALGVLAGLSWFLPRVKDSPLKAWAGINLVFLLILFCKETAIMFPPIIVAILLIDTPGDWRARLRKCIPVVSMTLPIVLFFALRSVALGPADTVGALEQPIAEQTTQQLVVEAPADPPVAEVPADSPVAEVSSDPPVTEVTTDPATTDPATTEITTDQATPSIPDKFRLRLNPRKLIPAAQVWFDALAKMFWPQPLLAFHGRSTTNIWLAITVQIGLLVLAFIAFMRRYPLPLLGLTIYYLALLPSSRILSQSPTFPHLAERYLYFPNAGLAISLAFILYWLMQKYSIRVVAVSMLVPALVLTPITWARNAEWVSTISIAQSDYDKGSRVVKNLQVLVAALVLKRENTRARRLCDRHAGEFPDAWYLNTTCGQVYEKSGLQDKAEDAYLLALNNKSGKASGHYSLALLYLGQKRTVEAKEQFEQAIAAEQQAFMQEFLSAEMLMKLYPNERSKLLEAKGHLETAIELQPQVLFTQQKLAELNKMLRVANR